MRLHCLQHVPFEGLGFIGQWAASREMQISWTRLYADEPLPVPDSFDWLVVMGGPMGIFDYDEHPWLATEKECIEQAIDDEKTVIGICLGAQLMADVLGAKVYPGPEKEIGWFPVRRSEGAPELIPEELTVFHWHGDTFDIPEGALKLAVSEAGINQGFVYNTKAVGLQFHMETTPASMTALIENCGHELVDAPWIQTAEEMKAGLLNVPAINAVMDNLLNNLLQVPR